MMSNLRNKNISINTELSFIKIKKYFNITTNKDLDCLRTSIRTKLNLNIGTIKNNSTGYEAKITKETIKKIIYPTNHVNVFNRRYIDDLNYYNYYSYSDFVAESINYNYVWVIN